MTVRSSGLIGWLVTGYFLCSEDIPLAVERRADAGDDPAEQLVADRHHERRAGGDDVRPGDDPLHVADRHEHDPVPVESHDLGEEILPAVEPYLAELAVLHVGPDRLDGEAHHALDLAGVLDRVQLVDDILVLGQDIDFFMWEYLYHTLHIPPVPRRGRGGNNLHHQCHDCPAYGSSVHLCYQYETFSITRCYISALITPSFVPPMGDRGK